MSSQLKTENYGLCQYGNNDIPDWRTDYTGDMAVIDDELANINKEVTGLKKYVSDGKRLVASAITDKGVETETDATFEELAANISEIQTGTEYRIGLTELTTSLCQSDEYVLPLCKLNCVAFHKEIKGTGGSLIL